jgi:hypothetical protein
MYKLIASCLFYAAQVIMILIILAGLIALVWWVL